MPKAKERDQVPKKRRNLLWILLKSLLLVWTLMQLGKEEMTTGIWMMMVYALAGSLAAVFALDHEQFRQRSAMTSVFRNASG